MSEKLCRYGVPYVNHTSGVLRTCLSGTCEFRPSQNARTQTSSVTHCRLQGTVDLRLTGNFVD